jgi:DNA-binding transcriptional ArsR family regulator
MSSLNIDAIFHALADGNRRKILEQLSSAPRSVSQLAEPLGVSLAAVVQHLKILEDSGLIASEKHGRVRTCRVEPDALSLAEHWISERRSLWERRLDRLGGILAEPD